MIPFIRKHPIGTGAGAVLAVLGLAWLAFGYFGVHTLFIDDVVDESGPVFDAAPVAFESAGPDATPPTPPAPAVDETDTALPTDDIAGSGGAEPTEPTPNTTEADQTTEATEPTETNVVDVADEPSAAEIVTEYQGVFESDAHPTAGTAAVLGNGTGQRFLRLEDFETDNGPDLNVYLVNSSTGDVSDYIDLGDLKGNIGDQNYEIPVGIDLDIYDEVVIWCVRFGVGFGDASLAPA